MKNECFYFYLFLTILKNFQGFLFPELVEFSNISKKRLIKSTVIDAFEETNAAKWKLAPLFLK